MQGEQGAPSSRASHNVFQGTRFLEPTRAGEETRPALPPVSVMVPAGIIAVIPGTDIVPRSVKRIPMPIDRSRVHVYRRRVAVGNRRSIAPIPWAGDDGAKQCCPCRYGHHRAAPRETCCGKTSAIPTRRSKAIKRVFFMASSFLLHSHSFCKVQSNNHAKRRLRARPEIAGVSVASREGFDRTVERRRECSSIVTPGVLSPLSWR